MAINQEEVNQWINKLINILTKKDRRVKIVMSNPLQKSSHKKIVVATNPDSQKNAYTINEFTKTQCFTKTVDVDRLSEYIHEKWKGYKQILILQPELEARILHNGKNQVTLKQEKGTHTNLMAKIDKQYLVPKTAPFLSGLGVTTQQGKIKQGMYGKYRQINKFVEILSTTFHEKDLRTLKLYDFGCGKGYLTMAIHHYLQSQGHQNIVTTGIDLKETVINKNRVVATESKLTNLTFTHSDISEIEMKKGSVLIALHACDIATDIALHKAIESQAKYIIISPCCHKQVRKSMTHHTTTKSITQHGILLERQAEILTDTIRCLLLESKGYRTDIFEFVSTEHTSKNLMIRAIYTGHKKDTTEQINQLKNIFTLREPQYLEQLLAGN